MAYARLQPLDDTSLYPFQNGQNPSPTYDTSRTFAEVLADVNAKGFNSCFITPDYNNGRVCYYTIACFNIPDTLTDYYVANNEFMEISGQDTALFIQYFESFAVPVTTYFYNYQHVLQQTATSNLLALFNTEYTKDNITYRRNTYGVYDYAYGAVFLTSANVNLYMNGSLPVTYQWSSVPAISGKNGILSLTQILNINDGEPVENVTNRGNLDFSKKTKVNTLVNSAYEPTYKEDQTKASVEYEIPEAEYQYTKLVYKKKKIPKSPNDGTAIDIGADDTEAFVSGLEENTTYYFVVFTNRTKSNAYKFKTGKNAPPEGIFKIRITTSQGVKDNDFKEVIEVTRV